jgi:hypothetical protein
MRRWVNSEKYPNYSLTTIGWRNLGTSLSITDSYLMPDEAVRKNRFVGISVGRYVQCRWSMVFIAARATVISISDRESGGCDDVVLLSVGNRVDGRHHPRGASREKNTANAMAALAGTGRSRRFR